MIRNIYPHFLSLKGEGVFFSDNYQIKKKFIVQKQFSHTIFLLEGNEQPDEIFPWFDNRERVTLEGQLEDGRSIYADNLMIVSIGENVELLPFEGVYIGNKISAPLFETLYPLIGLFEGKFKIEDDDWTIELIDSEDAALAERQSKSWKIPLEGVKLRLTKKEATTFEQFIEKAREIMLLLSLASGNGVTSYRQIALWNNNEMLEVWRKMTGDELGPGPCVPAFRFGHFLEQVLPVWKRWTPTKKNETRLAISYINLSGTGYLDNRLFHISQAWEFIATLWHKTPKLKESEIELRKMIKTTYREWKNIYPQDDPRGYWGSRITFSFRWPQIKKQMEFLAESRGIDLNKIGLDFEKLKRVRDNVAHRGKLPENMTSEKYSRFKLLNSAQKGLQLVLLIELGYSGMVNTENKGWKSVVNIRELLKHNINK